MWWKCLKNKINNFPLPLYCGGLVCNYCLMCLSLSSKRCWNTRLLSGPSQIKNWGLYVLLTWCSVYWYFCELCLQINSSRSSLGNYYELQLRCFRFLFLFAARLHLWNTSMLLKRTDPLICKFSVCLSDSPVVTCMLRLVDIVVYSLV